MKDGALSWWERPVWQAAIVAAAIMPLLWPRLPPLTDLPGHVARWHLALAGTESPLQRYFTIDWALMGNLGTDLPGIAIGAAIGVTGAAKLVVMLTVLVTMGAMLLLAHEVHGRVPPTALFALPLVYGWPFQLGFLNFALAQGLAFGALALWLRLGRTGRPRVRAYSFALIGLILWVTHSAGWGLFGLMAFGAELARLRMDGRNWPAAIGGTILACIPLALPVLIMIAGAPAAGTRAGDTGDWFNLVAKLIWTASVLRDRWAWFDLGSLLLLLLLLYMSARDRRLGHATLLGWPALACIAAFLLLPRLLLGGAFVDMRMMPAIWALALLAIRPPAQGHLARSLAIAGLIFFGARTAATTLSFVLRAGEQQAEIDAVSAIPRGAAVLALVHKPCLSPWSDMRADHLPAHAIIARDAFVNSQWAIPGQHYLIIRHKAAAPFDTDPSQLVYAPGCNGPGRTLAGAITAFPRAAFSHVWTIGERVERPREAGLVPVWTNGHSELYEVVGVAGLRRVDRSP